MSLLFGREKALQIGVYLAALGLIASAIFFTYLAWLFHPYMGIGMGVVMLIIVVGAFLWVTGPSS